MKKATITIAAALLLVVLLSLTAAAQNKTGFVGWGVRGGFDVSNLIGTDAKFAGDAPYRTRAGFTGGLWGIFGLSEKFALQSEVLYSMKGSRVTSGDNSLNIELSYVEVPFLLKMRAVDDMAVKPSIYAGPMVAFKVSDKIVRAYRGPDVPVTETDLALYNMPAEADGNSRSLDYGLVIGIDFYAVQDKAIFDIRYTHGMKTIDESDRTDIRNSNISISVGYGFF